MPKTIGAFRVEREIGHGGMGVVYLARDLRLNRLVALKFLATWFANDSAARMRLEREAQLLASLSHPNIAAIYQLVQDGGDLYLVLEYIPGEGLDERLRRSHVDVNEAFDIGLQVAQAMAATHARGVMHRDLKPSNVRLRPDGQVKIIDFGLGKGSVSEVDDARLVTAHGALLGTPAYMSPEQIRCETLDHRTDIWAFGCLLFEMLATKLPFRGETVSSHWAAILGDEPEWEALPEAVPPEIRELLGSCLAKRLQDREDSMGDVATVLGEVLGRLSPAARRAAPRRMAHHLPASLTRFVGRSREIAEVMRHLADRRMVTLTGPGGCGKTRLAIELARRLVEEYADGAWLVDLAPLANPALVPSTAASALGLTENSGWPIAGTLKAYLGSKTLLLLLDNCEHVVEACAALSETLLNDAPGLRILATSRQALGIAGEIVYPVPPLAVPSPTHTRDPDALRECDSVALFMDRAASYRPGFTLTAENAPVVAAICARLEGMPLPLEMAAARIRSLSAGELARRLNECFQVLSTGTRTAPEYHRTLRAVIDWSYDFLTEAEKALLRRLAVFPGGFVLEAAEHVCAGPVLGKEEILDALSGLVDKSLVGLVEVHGEARYRMLETIRQYAREKLLASGEEQGPAARHRDYYLSFVEQARFFGPERPAWVDRIEREHDNIRAAMCWCIKERDVEAALRFAKAAHPFWRMLGHFQEGSQWLTDVLSIEETSQPELRAHVQLAAVSFERGNRARAKSLVESSLRVFEELGNKPGIEQALHLSWSLAYEDGRLPRARELADMQLQVARETGEAFRIGRATQRVALMAMSTCDYGRARSLVEECIRISRDAGDSFTVAIGLGDLGKIAEAQGDFETARARYEERREKYRESGERWCSWLVLRDLVQIALKQGDYELACSFAEEDLALCRGLPERADLGWSLARRGDLAAINGDYDTATSSYNESLAVFREVAHESGVASALLNLGVVALLRREFDAAMSRIEEAKTILARGGDRRWMVSCFYDMGEVYLARGECSRAQANFEEGHALSQQLDYVRGAAGCVAGLAWSLRLQGDREQAKTKYRLAVRSWAELGYEGLAMPFEGLAALAISDGRCPRAARLLGAAEARRKASSFWEFFILPNYLRDYREIVAGASAGLEEADFKRLWAEGKAMSPPEAVAYALAE